MKEVIQIISFSIYFEKETKNVYELTLTVKLLFLRLAISDKF